MIQQIYAMYNKVSTTDIDFIGQGFQDSQFADAIAWMREKAASSDKTDNQFALNIVQHWATRHENKTIRERSLAVLSISPFGSYNYGK